ncbi:unnamed protein product [Phytophthora lilii]|uniref:Unnamed protein product n=1 Tax=Phytophthora lilii TaxID=2077276 RepID=A0A9W6U4R3_9STRA|nr:unnamed protein product [Phytophthora lilii]
MFPSKQEAPQHGRPSLLPPRLPRLHSHPSGLGRTVHFENHNDDDSGRYHDSLTLAGASSERQRFHSLHDRPRGRSLEEEATSLRTALPSLATLMTPNQRVQESESLHPQSGDSFHAGDQTQRLQLPGLVQDHVRAQTLAQVYTQAYPVVSAASPTAASSLLPNRRLVSAPLSGLSAFADPDLVGMRNLRYGTSPSHRSSSRWSPYASASISVGRPISSEASQAYSIPYNDEIDGAKQSHRRRRTSPRRRLAAFKARARALQMAMDGQPVGIVNRFENDQTMFQRQEKKVASTLLVAPPPMISLGRSLPMPLRSPSPALVDESDTSPTKKNSRYLREKVDRRTILARLDRGEKQSALAKEFRVTRAAICHLNEHRDLVLSRQHEDPLAKYPKKAKRKQGSEDEAEIEDGELSQQNGSNRVSLLLSAAVSPSAEDSQASSQPEAVHAVALQPAERLIPLLLSGETTDADFRRYCDRLMTMVVEEVLAWAHTEARTNLTARATPCGVSIAPGGSPMLSIFQALEPELPTGHIKHNLPPTGSPVAVVLDLPSAIASHNVCLFYAFTDEVGGVRVAKSIRELLDRGAVEELLCLVTLAVSAFTVGELQRAHPSLRIAAAHVESKEDIDDWLQQSNDIENEQRYQNNNAGEPSTASSRLQLLASRVAEIY